jgi:quercetin dioxygenase-like cupin family protein
LCSDKDLAGLQRDLQSTLNRRHHRIQIQEKIMLLRITACAAVVLFAMGHAGVLHAQQPGIAAQPQTIKRTILQKMDVPGSNYETVIGIAETVPNANIGRQSHPGAESGYVLQGSGTILVEGKPPLQLSVGKSYNLASGVVHDVRSGPDGIKLIVVWVVEKGKPLISP